MLKVILALVLVAACVASANKQICNQAFDCHSDQYCNNGYCVECRSHSDCKTNEICSTNAIDLGKFGTCIKFDSNGDDCIALNANELQDERVSNSSKCGVFYYNHNLAINSRMVQDANVGTCVSGKCRMCVYSNTNTNFNGAGGKGAPRECVFPGKFATTHSSEWSSGRYFESPIHVWLAIFFCLIVLILTFHALGMFMGK
ncbi:hypothetical protein CYY_000693 [Polysphondylium violaceum]|uniref:Uncharacterized protein n=1 Tax=Polysphondylium violaceum TaxID=133409 RepID=A0A8J4VB95_9MYCE|nr:hypothetical protein CYY_000693 [Polysphondylium violaceum]